MVTAFLDTNVLIDLLRGQPLAETWLITQSDLAITPMVWLEILEGVQNKTDQQKAVKLLKRFQRVDFTPTDYSWAINQALKFKLSHGSGTIDCLIASISFRLQVPLYTHNLKHLRPILGSLAQKPY